PFPQICHRSKTDTPDVRDMYALLLFHFLALLAPSYPYAFCSPYAQCRVLSCSPWSKLYCCLDASCHDNRKCSRHVASYACLTDREVCLRVNRILRPLPYYDRL